MLRVSRLLSTCSRRRFDMDTNILAVPDGQPAPSRVQSFSAKGFTVNGQRLTGAVALLPKHKLTWQVQGVNDITEAALELFCVVLPRIGALVWRILIQLFILFVLFSFFCRPQ